MFCPKCGRQRVSEEVRFCTQCGFALDPVTMLLRNEGLQLVPPPREKGLAAYLRRKRVLMSTKIMFFSICSFPLSVPLSAIFDNPAPLLLLTIFPFMFGFAHMVYTLLFRPADPPPAPHMPVWTPPAQIPQPERYDTDMLPPPSVVDNTTKLLREDR